MKNLPATRSLWCISEPYKIGNAKKDTADSNQQDGIADEIRINHQANATSQWNEFLLPFAINKITQANSTKQHIHQERYFAIQFRKSSRPRLRFTILYTLFLYCPDNLQQRRTILFQGPVIHALDAG